MNLNIGSETKTKPSFELVLQVRDRDGNATGQTKSYITDDEVALHRFWLRNSNVGKKKRKKTGAAKTNAEVKDALKEVESYTKIIRRKRKLED